MNHPFAAFDSSQAQAWVILIAAVSAALVSIISAIKSKSNGAKLDVTDRKLDEIHVLTNNNLTAVKADLEVALKDIVFLKEFISKNTTPPSPDTPEHNFVAKIELAAPPETKTAAVPSVPLPEPPFTPRKTL